MHNQLKPEKYYPAWFLLPGGVIFCIFFVFPTFASFIYAFTNWSSFSPSPFRVDFVGLSNFKRIMEEPGLNIAFRNTFIFTAVVTVFKCAFGLLLALLVSKKLPVQGYLRTIFFFPCILSSVAIGLIFLAMYNPSTGLVNTALEAIGLGALRQDWIGNLDLVIFSVCGAEIWKWTGYTMVILLAGLSGVPGDVLEAAEIDGCGPFQKFRYVTFPLIRSSINISMMLSIISGLKVFDIVYAVSGGGPGYASDTFNTVVFKKFSQGFYGLSTAEGLILFFLIIGIAFPLNYWMTKKEVEL